MGIKYDVWLIALSLLASSAAMFSVYDFINRLYRTEAANRTYLLPAYAAAVGTGLWGIHFINLMAMHDGSHFDFVKLPVFLSLLLALVAAFTILYIASQKFIPIKFLASGGLTTGICYYALNYFSLGTLYNLSNISLEPALALCTLLMAIAVATLIIILFAWMKDYAGENPILVKLIFSLVAFAAVLGVHMTFNASVSLVNADHIVTTASDIASKKMLGIIIAMALLCLFLLAFVVAIFYEELGVNSFKLSLLNFQDGPNAAAANLKDSLTQLPNRRAFQHNIEAAARRSVRTNTTMALAYIDLDHFKPINDQFGHHVGDAVLITVAERLNAAVRGCDSLARLGGDEFVALLEDIDSDEDIIAIAERIVSSIKEPIFVSQQQIDISCSVGIAVYPRDGDIDKLMISADAAMYKAKENGKNQFKFFDVEIELASDQILEMQRDLRLALANNEFSLVFQPKVDCKTQSPVGAEALIRWNHPTKGLILPITFMPAAERFGLVNQINDWVIEESCRAIYRAKKAKLDLNISINLSRQQFRNSSLVGDVIKVLKRYNVAASRLTFEVKEITAIKNEAQFKRLLAQFKAANIKVALDDFGSQPFSLTYLQNIQVDELKLDKVFVAQVDENPASRVLVDAVIRLAHALNLSVVAGGVETEAQRVALAELGCDHMQGYLFSKPISEQKLIKLFKQLITNYESSGQFLVSDYQEEADLTQTPTTLALH
jgi:diguanylate cyclase